MIMDLYMMRCVLFVCGVCQVLSTIISILEMFWSEYSHHFQLPVQVLHNPATGFTLSTGLALCLTMKYLGAIFHVFASCFLVKFMTNLQTVNSVRTLVAESAGFLTTQLLGVVALLVRLVVLLYHSIYIVYRGDNIPTFEHYHIMLGVAAGFGFIALFSYIFYVFAFMYEKLVKIEDCDKIITSITIEIQQKLVTF